VGLFTRSRDLGTGRPAAPARPSLARTFVREVHTTLFQLFVYVCLLAGVGLAGLEMFSRSLPEHAAVRNTAAPATPVRADWIKAAHDPALRGRQ
jgi:hypothetical protein